MKLGKPTTAVLYARVSTEEQARKGYSLAQQMEALREYVLAEGYEILDEISDEGQSGASLDRPGLDRVRDLVAGGGIGMVLAQDRDRLAREPAHHYLLRLEFEEHGCKLRALNDRGDDTPEGELTDGIMDQLAKYERAKTAERTRRGRLRKAREGKVPCNGTPDYGFRFNEARDSYVVNPKTMPLVERIFRMVGHEGFAIHGVVAALNREGTPAPGGGRWNGAFVRKVILDDVYKPHSLAEIAPLVSPGVAAGLDPEGYYGVYWYNKVKRENRQVGETGQDGGRVYRVKSRTVPKPREEWIAVPVPDPGIPREVVDAAREAIKGNKKSSSAGSRFWELSGGIARCAECGRALTAARVARKRSGKVDLYYRCLGYWQAGRCTHKKYHRAEDLERRVREAMLSLLNDHDEMYAYLTERVEQDARRDLEREAKDCAGRLAELDERLSRAQDLAIKGLLPAEALRSKTAEIRRERESVAHELEGLKDAREHAATRKWQRNIVFHFYMVALMHGWDLLSPEDFRLTYKKLNLRVLVAPDGTLEIKGALDTNVLPTDMMYASRVFWGVDEKWKKELGMSLHDLIFTGRGAKPPPRGWDGGSQGRND